MTHPVLVKIIQSARRNIMERSLTVERDDAAALSETILKVIGRYSCDEHQAAVMEFAKGCLDEVTRRADAAGTSAWITVSSNTYTMRDAALAHVLLQASDVRPLRAQTATWSDAWFSPSPERFVRTDLTTILAAEHYGVSPGTLAEHAMGRVHRGVRRVPTGLKGDLPCFEMLNGNHVRTRFDAGDGLTWDGDRLVTHDLYPNTVTMGLPGLPASTLSGHPAFCDERQVMGKVTMQPTRTMIQLRRNRVLLDEQGREIDRDAAKRLGDLM